MEQFHIEVEEEVESVDTLLDREYVLCSLRGCVNLLYLCEPSVQVMILPRRQCLLEVVADLLQLLSLMEVFPVLAKDIFNSTHIDSESSLDLFSPENFVRDCRETPDLVPHC